MRILITGGCGYLGAQLARFLEGVNPPQIIIMDNLSVGSLTSLAGLKGKGDYFFFEGDIRSVEDLRQVLHGVDAVFHFAALTSVERSLKEPKTSYEVNYEGTSNLLRESVNAGVKWFIFPSTFHLYGRSGGFMCKENDSDKVQVTNPYAYSKLLAEHECYKYENKMNILIFRLGALYGLSPGIRFNVPVNKFALDLVRGAPLTVLGSGDHVLALHACQ